MPHFKLAILALALGASARNLRAAPGDKLNPNDSPGPADKANPNDSPGPGPDKANPNDSPGPGPDKANPNDSPGPGPDKANPNDSPGPSVPVDDVKPHYPTFFGTPAPQDALAPPPGATGGQLTLPGPITPIPPCWLPNFLARIAGPGTTSTADACRKRCPGRVDVSGDFAPSPFVSGTRNYMASAQPVCAVVTEMHMSDVTLSDHDDCLFVCKAHGNSVEALPGDDLVYIEKGLNNKINLNGGADRCAIRDAMLNLIMGGSEDDRISVRGDQNKISGEAHDDEIVIVGDSNDVKGEDGDDKVRIFGDNNNVEGQADADTLRIYWGSGNTLDGGSPGAPTDTCPGPACLGPNTCINCAFP